MTGPDLAAAELAALVGSRLCHDLVSPLGAIGNGVELLKMMNAHSDELALIEQAVETAQARVKLFRLAFGNASEGQEVSARDFAEALAGLGLRDRVRLRTALPAPLPRPRVKRLALAALCAETALAYGGELAVGQDDVCALAPRLRLDPPLWRGLEEGALSGTLPAGLAAGLVAGNVHFALLALTGPVVIENGLEGLTIRV